MSLPRTLGELQLYRLLQRANLLAYYDTFIQQGGDDVKQLCEAGEEEFLEIMALVGMATKPLHVRRLQKALREWMANPAIFNQPLASVPVSSIPLFKLSGASAQEPKRKSVSNGRGNSPEMQAKHLQSFVTASARSISPNSSSDGGEKNSPVQISSDAPVWQGWHTPEADTSLTEEDQVLPPSPRENTCKLDLDTVRTIAESVRHVMNTFPKSDPQEAKELLRLNKKLAKSIGHIFEMEKRDPVKEEEIRKYSAIYGRSDSKRRDSKQLTQHELTINEAAAQFCMEDNTLLMRRVDLFSLARQVARECAYTCTYRKTRLNSDEVDGPAVKNIILENHSEVGSGRTMVVPSQTEFFEHRGIDSAGSKYNTEEDNSSLSSDILSGRLQESRECLKGSCQSASNNIENGLKAVKREQEDG
uniref:NGFI-A-binding protein 2 isoform X2 n=1 Tax=Pristiophorus japonicus TaxID=55135 RepID=UPI00398F4E31